MCTFFIPVRDGGLEISGFVLVWRYASPRSKRMMWNSVVFPLNPCLSELILHKAAGSKADCIEIRNLLNES